MNLIEKNEQSYSDRKKFKIQSFKKMKKKYLKAF